MKKNKLGTVGFILSIIGLVGILGYVGYFFIDFVFSDDGLGKAIILVIAILYAGLTLIIPIIGTVFSAIGTAKRANYDTGKKIAIAGLIINIAQIVVVFIIYAIIYIINGFSL